MAGWCLGERGPENPATFICRPTWEAVWDGRYLYSPGEYNVLYDHQNDPFEMENLIDSDAHRFEKERLHALMTTLSERASTVPDKPVSYATWQCF